MKNTLTKLITLIILTVLSSCSFEITDGDSVIYEADLLGGWEIDIDPNYVEHCSELESLFFTKDEMRIRLYSGENCQFNNDSYYDYNLDGNTLLVIYPDGYEQYVEVLELSPLELILQWGSGYESRYIR